MIADETEKEDDEKEEEEDLEEDEMVDIEEEKEKVVHQASITRSLEAEEDLVEVVVYRDRWIGGVHHTR